MSLRDDRDFEQAIHSSELQAENDRLRSQLEGCEERLRRAEKLFTNLRDEALDRRRGTEHGTADFRRLTARARAFNEALTALREGRETQTP